MPRSGRRADIPKKMQDDNTADFGPLLSEHRTPLFASVIRLASGTFLCFLAYLILSVANFFQGSWYYFQFILFLFTLAPIAFIFMLFGACQLVAGLLSFGIKIHRHTNGIVYRGWTRPIAIRWEGVRSVFRRNLDVLTYRSRVIRNIFSFSAGIDIYTDGNAVFINCRTATFDNLRHAIEDKVTGVLLPQAIEAFSNNERLDFGRIGLDSQGIWRAPSPYNRGKTINIDGADEKIEDYCRKFMIPWNKVRNVTVNSSIIVKAIGDGPNAPSAIRISVTKVNNPLLLVRLLLAVGVCQVDEA
jgi:hypothetical protein